MRWFVVCSLLAALAGCIARGSTFSTGSVSDEQGKPVAGAVVTALSPDSVVAVSVYTDASGQYRLPDLPGTYTLSAHAPGYERASLGTLATQRNGQARIVLPTTEDIFAQLPASAFLTLLPEGEEKRRFVLDCAGCHQFDQRQVWPQEAPRTREMWLQRTNQMLSFAGAHTGFPIMSPSSDAEATADWLVTHLGETTRPTPSAAPPAFVAAQGERVVITEYDLPVPFDLPHDLMPDHQGRIIVTGMMTHQMYVLDPDSGWTASVPIPQRPSGARALDIGPDGAWWVLLGAPQQIAKYDPTTRQWTTHPIGMYPHSIKRDAKGRIWFNGHFTRNPELIGYLDEATGTVQTFEVPTPPMPDGGSTIPYGLRVDAAGIVWATQLTGNRLIRFDPESEQFKLYDLPTTLSGPRRPAIGPDGHIWIPAFAANKLARFDPAIERFTEYSLPIPDALPYIVRVDPRDGAVWIATGAADAVLRFLPSTGQFSVYPLPTQKALIRHMELDPKTGAAWVAYGNSPATDPKIARIEVHSH